MTFGPDCIYLCPRCREVFVKNSLGSGNTFGARVWSDGKIMASMMPILPIIHYCGNCRSYFFWEDARRLGYAPMGTFDSLPFVVGTWDCMSLDDYERALEQGVHRENPVRELALRTRLLWAANDPVRYTDYPRPREVQTSFSENLSRMEALLKEGVENTPEERLFYGELLREMARFDEAREVVEEIINKPIPSGEDEDLEGLKERAEKILEKIRDSQAKVFELTKEENEARFQHMEERLQRITGRDDERPDEHRGNQGENQSEDPGEIRLEDL